MKKLLMLAAALTVLAPLAAIQMAVAQVQPAQPQTAQAQTAMPVQAPFTDPASVPADLKRVDYAMNHTASFSGRFAQYAADGSFAQGQVYIKRPGKLRFEYDAPNPLLIVSDGVTLAQQDKALETIDRVPLSATPLNYFLKENINLAKDTEIIGLVKTYNEWRITARDGSGEMDGVMTMVFDASTLALKEWIIADSFGGETRVLLSELKYNERINPRLFILRDENRRDRRK